jgi:hypothetical protein
MDIVDRSTFAALASHRGWPSVSIYLPTHRAGAQKEQDPIRLRNLVNSAVQQLVAEGMRSPDAEALLADVRDLVDTSEFWREGRDALAIFVRPGETRVLEVDVALPEQLVVGGRFSLRALALAYHGDERFFALAFDRDRSRLFEGDRGSIRELEIVDGPGSFAEATKFDEREESLQFTTHASPESVAGAGPAIGMFHGHGGENVDKTELQRFAADVSKAVTGVLGAEGSVPLVLLGVEYQLAAYRSANAYPALADEQVLGATDEMNERAIQLAAFGALEPRFRSAVEADLAELREKPSTLVTTDPAEIVTAAAAGRVKSLFFDDSTGPYGQFDAETFAVSKVCSAAPRYLRETADSEEAAAECGWDLVDLAAAETVRHGGAIHAFAGEHAPVDGVAAVLRY